MKNPGLWMYSVGAAFLLSLPWMFLFPGWILLVGFVPLFFLEERLRQGGDLIQNRFVFRNHLLLCFGLWNLLSAWWLGYATVVGLLLFLFLNTFLMTAIWYLYFRFKEKNGNALSSLFLIGMWLSFEYLHFNWDMQLPGMTMGGVFGTLPEIVQWYEFTGILGGSLWILLTNILIFRFISGWQKRRELFARPLLLVVLVVVVPVFFSLFRYFSYSEEGTKFSVTVLQPNIDPYSEKFSGLSEKEQLGVILNLLDSAKSGEACMAIGPETALASFWEDSVVSNQSVWELQQHLIGSKLKGILIGANTKKILGVHDLLTPTARLLPDGRHFEEYNSALFILPDTVLFYHKNILVSGVEKVPFVKVFSFLRNFYFDLGGTSGGLGEGEPQNFQPEFCSPFSPLICFESMFGEFLSSQVRQGGQWVAILTNDGWWKQSSGARLHFSYARLRAVETRRCIARSANTGISGIINQRGEVLICSLLGKQATLDGELRSNQRITFYAEHGDFIGRIAVFVSVLLLLLFWSRNLSHRNISETKIKD